MRFNYRRVHKIVIHWVALPFKRTYKRYARHVRPPTLYEVNGNVSILLRARVASAKDVAIMGWYCPKCRTPFVEFQSTCPHYSVPLKKSKYEDRIQLGAKIERSCRKSRLGNSDSDHPIN